MAFASGMIFGLLHATLTVPLGLSQHVVGLGVTLLATSHSYFAYRLALPEVTSPPRIEPFQPLEIPILSDIPILGEALFAQTPLTYAAFAVRGAHRLRALPHAAWALPCGRRARTRGGRGAGAVGHRRCGWGR